MSPQTEKLSYKHEKDCPVIKLKKGWNHLASPMTTMYDKGNGEKYLACYHCYAPVTYAK